MGLTWGFAVDGNRKPFHDLLFRKRPIIAFYLAQVWGLPHFRRLTGDEGRGKLMGLTSYDFYNRASVLPFTVSARSIP